MKKMGRPKKFTNSRSIGLIISLECYEHICRKAHQMSLQEGRQISVSEAIRMAIELCYPMGKQMDMFD